jgi:hypothetical protein
MFSAPALAVLLSAPMLAVLPSAATLAVLLSAPMLAVLLSAATLAVPGARARQPNTGTCRIWVCNPLQFLMSQ